MIKKLLITAVLAVSVVSAHAEPAPVLPPSPTVPTPTPTQIGIVGNDVIRPTTSANAETYKKVPIDKAKIGNYMKKMPKGGFLELGIAVGIVALGEAVDYLIDNSKVKFIPQRLICPDNKGGNGYITPEQWSKNYCDSIGKPYQRTHDFGTRQFIAICTKQENYFSHFTCYGSPIPESEITLDDMADKVIDAGKKGNPTAVRVINDWADDEIRRNPDAYPDVVPQPQPQPSPDPLPQPDPNPKPNPVPQPSPDPVGDPKTNPSPNPNAPPSGNPATNPNPADNPSGTPNTQPDPATSPNDGTNPNEQTFNFELPAFCSWATIVCEFIGTKPDMPDEPLPTKDIPLKTPAEFDKNYVDFGGQCPADINVDIDLAFAKHTISYSFTPICDFVQNYLRIVIIIGAYLFATLHISSAFKI